MRQLVRPRYTVRVMVACNCFTLLDELPVIQQQVSFEAVIFQGHPLLVCPNEFKSIIRTSSGLAVIMAVDL
jgi:hypothetical protein